MFLLAQVLLGDALFREKEYRRAIVSAFHSHSLQWVLAHALF